MDIIEFIKGIVIYWFYGFIAVLGVASFMIPNEEFEEKKEKLIIAGSIMGLIVVGIGLLGLNANGVWIGVKNELIKAQIEVQKTANEESSSQMEVITVSNKRRTSNSEKSMGYQQIDIEKVAQRIKKVHDNDKHGQNYPLNYSTAIKYAVEIEKWAKYYDLDPKLVLSIAQAETNFVARSKFWDRKGYSLGLYSMRVSTAKNIWHDFLFLDEKGKEYANYKVVDPLNMGTRLACFHINWLRGKFDSRHKVITAYNRGVNAVAEVNPKEYPYTQKVNRNYRQFVKK